MALTERARKRLPKFTATESDPLKVVAKVRAGIPYTELKKFQASSGLTVERIASVTGLPRRTLLRRKGHKLNREESQALVRLERLYAIAFDVFEDEALAKAWLQRPNPDLAWKSPLEFVDTDVGARQVEHLMGQIEHGVF